MSKKYKVGDKVEATIKRPGGSAVKVLGEVVGFETDFGREDLVIGKGTTEKFVVNEKNVKVLKS